VQGPQAPAEELESEQLSNRFISSPNPNLPFMNKPWGIGAEAKTEIKKGEKKGEGVPFFSFGAA